MTDPSMGSQEPARECSKRYFARRNSAIQVAIALDIRMGKLRKTIGEACIPSPKVTYSTAAALYDPGL